MELNVTEKRPISEKQRAHLARLAERNRQSHSNAPPVSGRQSFLARMQGRPRRSIEDVEEIEEQGFDEEGRAGRRSPLAQRHALAGQVTVEHITDEKVKMWKRGPYGWFPREVPSHTIPANLANGWMEYCPDCRGTDCELDPNTCPVKRGRKYITCPVVQAGGIPCGKRIYVTGVLRSGDREAGEFEVTTAYDSLTPEAELRAKMDIHIMTYHRDEARMLRLFRPREAAPSGIDIQSPEELTV